jgi:hypothetical protein
LLAAGSSAALTAASTASAAPLELFLTLQIRTLSLSLLLLLLLLLQAAVVACGWQFCRIDGSMSSTDAAVPYGHNTVH